VTADRRATAVKMLVWIGPVVLVAILRPWTVRHIETDTTVDGRRSTVDSRVFDPARFAASAWPRLVGEANNTAVNVSDIVPAPGAPPSQARFVKGVGMVTSVDRRSRVGVMLVRLVSSSQVVAIQIGPVMRGTALRDASGFIQFSDFTNQSEYAAAANALNESALRLVIAPVEFETLTGQVVSFVGAVGKSPMREDGAIEVVPVRLGVSVGAQ